MEPVGVPLQLRQVVEERRRHPLLLRLQRFDDGPPGAHPVDDGLRLHAVRIQPPRLAHALEARGRHGLAIRPRAEPRALVQRVRRNPLRPGREGGHELQVVTRHEVADGQLALHHHGQRGRLHPAHAQHLSMAPVRQRVQARQVHPHQPVRPAAPHGRGGQRFVFTAVREPAEAVLDGPLRQRRHPQPLYRLAALRRVVDVPEDKLALAPRVRCAHHRGHLRRVEHLLHHLELAARLLGDDQRPVRREHGQQRAAPLLPVRANLMGLRQAHQVPDGPRHHVAIAAQPALTALVRPQHPRDVARHRGLLRQHGQQGGATGGRLRTAVPASAPVLPGRLAHLFPPHVPCPLPPTTPPTREGAWRRSVSHSPIVSG